MTEPLWPGGPTLCTDPRNKPKSKRFSRLDQAQAALGIKDDEEGEEPHSEIDKRLGLAYSSPKTERNGQLNYSNNKGGSTCSTTHSSYSASTSEGSVYGGVVLRRVSNKPDDLESKEEDEEDKEKEGGEESERDVVSPVSLPELSRQRSATIATSSTGDEIPVDLGGIVKHRNSSRFNRGVSLPAPETNNKDTSKRKRFTGSDFLTRASHRSKEDKRKSTSPSSDHSGTVQDQKKKNRFSTLYNSVRGTKRREQKQSGSSEAEKVSDAKTLRLLEEKMCNDPKKLLADRVRELRKVGDPDNPRQQIDTREDFPLFEFVCEVSLRRKSENFCPYISWSHPPLRVLEDTENDLAAISLNIPTFCFPDMDIVEPVKKMKTETYCFVFTDLQAQNKFGYCRRFLPAAKSTPAEKRFPVVYCMVTKLRSFETFSKIFDQVVELRHFSSAGAYSFLKALIEQNAPKPGKKVTVRYINPKIGNLVDIHVERVTAGKRFEHVDLAYVLSKLGSKLLVEIFVNLLVERKLLFVAENLSDLTTIIHSIMQLLYPLHWQGIYIPVLPQEIIDATSSPVPFVIGILKQHAKTLDTESLDDECNLVYITEKRIEKRPNFTDIPFNKKYRKKFLLELKQYKARLLKEGEVKGGVEHTVKIGDMFYQFMRTLIGHYNDHVTFDEKGESDIDLTSFSDSSGVHCEFVWQLSKTQMFSSFIQGLTRESINPFEGESGQDNLNVV